MTTKNSMPDKFDLIVFYANMRSARDKRQEDNNYYYEKRIYKMSKYYYDAKSIL